MKYDKNKKVCRGVIEKSISGSILFVMIWQKCGMFYILFIVSVYMLIHVCRPEETILFTFLKELT